MAKFWVELNGGPYDGKKVEVSGGHCIVFWDGPLSHYYDYIDDEHTAAEFRETIKMELE